MSVKPSTERHDQVTEPAKEPEVGFELDGDFFPLTVNLDNGKDLMLIDRLTAMDTLQFRECLQDGIGIGRGAIQLALIATSIRAKYPTWTVERIYRQVTGDLANMTWVGGDEEDEEVGPPAESVPATPQGRTPSSSSTSEGSLSSPIPTANGHSETSSAILV